MKALDGHTATLLSSRQASLCPLPASAQLGQGQSRLSDLCQSKAKLRSCFDSPFCGSLWGCALLSVFFPTAIPLWDGCSCLRSPNGVSSPPPLPSLLSGRAFYRLKTHIFVKYRKYFFSHFIFIFSFFLQKSGGYIVTHMSISSLDLGLESLSLP